MILDAFARRRAHETLRRLTAWDDLAIDRALREPVPLRAGAVIVVNTAGVAMVTRPATRSAA